MICIWGEVLELPHFAHHKLQVKVDPTIFRHHVMLASADSCVRNIYIFHKLS